jgi:hypothetical protein
MFVNKKLFLSLVLGVVMMCASFGVLKVNAQTPVPSSGDNKFGLNVAAKSDQIMKGVKGLVKENGWVTFIPNAAQGNSSQNVTDTVNEIVGVYFSSSGTTNYVLRGHFPGTNWVSDKQNWANFWLEVLAKIENKIPAGSEFYFMPLNEPNVEAECENKSATDCVSHVISYVNMFVGKPIFTRKIKLLTPAFNVSNPNFSAFFGSLQRGINFSQFSGIAINYYDFQKDCSETFCTDNAFLNPSKFKELLAAINLPNMKVFMTEVGVVKSSGSFYQQPAITKLICGLNNKFKDDSQLMMFSPLTYDPENGDQEWFWNTSQTQAYYRDRTGDCTNFGRDSKLEERLLGRDPYNREVSVYPYCPALSSDLNNTVHGGSGALTPEMFKSCRDGGGSMAAGIFCPDYSPNRPYPGDTCIDFESTYVDKAKKTDITTFKQKAFKIEAGVKYDLCEGSPGSGTCMDDHNLTLDGRAAISYLNSFVDFLGTNNEYTSNPQYVMDLNTNIQRTAMFLTDFLGGMTDSPGIRGRSHEMKDFLDAYQEYNAAIDGADGDLGRITEASINYLAKISAIPNLKENLQLTSGALGKLTPENAKLNPVDPTPGKSVFDRWLTANLNPAAGYGTDPTNMPVGDYVVAYKCAIDPQVLLNEEDFPDTLERRKAISSRTEADCSADKIVPIRISDFVCSASHTDVWNQLQDRINITPGVSLLSKASICRGKELLTGADDLLSGAKWDEKDLATLKKYFLAAVTHEDVPVRVEITCPTWAKPGTAPNDIPAGRIYPKKLTEAEMRKEGIGVKYAIDRGFDGSVGMQKYELVRRNWIYIGHLAEAREQAFKMGNLLFTKAVQDQAIDPKKEGLDVIFNQQSFDPESVTAPPSTTGDMIAEDYVNRTYKVPDKDRSLGYTIAKKVNLTDGDRRAIQKWENYVPVPGVTGGPKMPEKSVGLSTECEIKIDMPYIQETAARTIGTQHGFYRTLFSLAEQKVIDEYILQSKNKGMGAASSTYENLSLKYDSTGENIVPNFTNFGNGTSEQVNFNVTDEQSIYIPWLDAMKTYNMITNSGINPLALQKTAVIPGTGTGTGTGGDTKADSCLTEGVDKKDVSVDRVQLAKMFNCYSGFTKCDGIPSYPNSAIGVNSSIGQQMGRELWNQLISTSISGGLNPYLALAYWGEETHFTNPGENGNPKMGLGCGAPPGGSSCIADGTPEEEFAAEFRCFVGTNPVTVPKRSCNNTCMTQKSTFDFIGCYQNGAGHTPSPNHLQNLMIFYHRLKGDSMPICP